MEITRFVVNMIDENCYLINDDGGEAALIDCGAFYPEERMAISRHIAEHKFRLTHLFNTHGHFDHLFGADYIYKEYGVKIEMCADERETYENAEQQMKKFIHRDLPIALPPVGRWFNDGDTLTVGSISLQVIATPGHTPGGVCFYDETDGVLFSGDSLFRHSIGRCDLPGGNETTLVSTLRERILTLPDDVTVLPGHGGATTIGEEKHANPYFMGIF